MPRIVNNLIIYPFLLQERSRLLSALLLDMVLFVFVTLATQRKRIPGLIDASFLTSPLFTMCFC